MRDINRIATICSRLEKAWLKHPDMRLGQIVVAASKSPFYIEDEKLINEIENLLK